MTTPHWTDAHIVEAYCGETIFIAYDKNDTALFVSLDRDEVVRHLEACSDQLEEPSPHPVAPCASWSDAPSWATHTAIDASGEEWWYSIKPLWDENDKVWYLPNYGRDTARLAQNGSPIDPADAALSCFERPTPVELDEPLPLPRINIRGDFTDGPVYGSMYLPVDHVELEDDGSYTAVIKGYWPK